MTLYIHPKAGQTKDGLIQEIMEAVLRWKTGHRTYYQWAHGGKVVSTECLPMVCLCGPRTVYWAWDRSLGAWVHYTGIAWGKESMATVAYV